MINRNVKLKNRNGDYLLPYTDNIPTASALTAGKVKLDSSPTSGSNNAITSGAVYTALESKLSTSGTATKATADENGNNIANTYLQKTETAAKATADADGNNIASTYLKKTDEGKGGLNLLVNQLQKAYAWLWSETLTNGTAYIIKSNNALIGEITCTSYSAEYSYNPYVAINGNMYYWNDSSDILTQQIGDGDITQMGYGVAIRAGGKLYSYFSKNYVDSTTGWTKIVGNYGIKNGALAGFTNQGALSWGILDSAGVWTDLNGTYGIRDGYPYSFTKSGAAGTYNLGSLTQLSTENGWSKVSTSGSYVYFAKNSKYLVFYSNFTTPTYSGDLNEEISKLFNNFALTVSGKLYDLNSNNPSCTSEGVIALGPKGYLKSDGVYNYSKVKIIDGEFTDMEGVLLFAGVGTTQHKTVYTVANPEVNYIAYEKLDLRNNHIITATTATSVTLDSKTYNRDIAKDAVFTQTPNDLKKQAPTKWELLDMINNLE